MELDMAQLFVVVIIEAIMESFLIIPSRRRLIRAWQLIKEKREREREREREAWRCTNDGKNSKDENHQLGGGDELHIIIFGNELKLSGCRTKTQKEVRVFVSSQLEESSTSKALYNSRV
ncbi:hypothetical protein GGU10DRAFT_334602 [Lentinula aff. detonsa]|uniref:Uncharacterized protein n=1 Tax=Lentinula aff. detonsa TaxID=2804958 RepID=A0AA38KV87_9AGAR|nr:hypothetical protein GGU10DRAFT_334602 [Lentinula aff. detonsa]